MVDTNELFRRVVTGQYPLSNNAGAARNWLPTDVGEGPYIPRPDCSLTWLQIFSAFPLTGLLGIDHFYLRSPLTGVAKMLSFGGLGLWYLWDTLQVLTESDRVRDYGMSTPFDFITGIGQGMITDLPSAYGSKVWYSWWIVGILFGFVGLDSLFAKNGGQFLRKLLEFSLFAWCFINVMGYFTTGITFGWIVSLLFMSFLGSIIIAEYISVMSLVFFNNVFEGGIQFEHLEEKQYNSFFSWLINSTWFADETKKDIIKDLQYGGISAEEIREMFKIQHQTVMKEKEKEEEQEQDQAKDSKHGSYVSFVYLILSPFLIVMTAIWNGCVTVFGNIPIFKAWSMAAETASKVGDAQVMMMTAQVEGLRMANMRSASSGDASAKSMVGGGKDKDRSNSELSTESHIMGITLFAIIIGGTLKGLVDYLLHE